MPDPSQKREYPVAYDNPEPTTPFDNWVRLTSRTLNEYRQKILLAMGVVLVGLLVGIAAAYLILPTQRLATLYFRLTFDGIDQGLYPNGSKFSSEEIVATPVLTEVYEKNDLRRFSTFQVFKDSIFVLESNRELDRLEREYEAKFQDVKLTPVDRERLEKEYQKKREALKVPEFSMNVTRNEYAVSIPSALLGKVLNDILHTWADDADLRKGALKYRVPVYSRNFINKAAIEAEDYVVVLDILRSKINTMLANIDVVSGLPGATVMRVGKNGVNLAEVKADLEDLRHFQVEPLIKSVISNSLSKDPRGTIRYAEARLAQIRRDQDEAQGRARTYQNALSQYMQERGSVSGQDAKAAAASGGGAQMGGTVIPQFGESFLNQLMEMTTLNQGSDIQFRQATTEQIISEGLRSVILEKETAYYEAFLAALRASMGGASQSETVTPMVASVKTRTAAITDRIVEASDRVVALYDQLSTQNLNPRTMLYMVTGPVVITRQASLQLSSALLYAFLLFVMSALVIVLACILHARFREDRTLAATRQVSSL